MPNAKENSGGEAAISGEGFSPGPECQTRKKRVKRFELSASSLARKRSSQLSYTRPQNIYLEKYKAKCHYLTSLYKLQTIKNVKFLPNPLKSSRGLSVKGENISLCLGISSMNSKGWRDRKKAQEEEFFLKQEKAALERLATNYGSTPPVLHNINSPMTGEPMKNIKIGDILIWYCTNSGGMWIEKDSLGKLGKFNSHQWEIFLLDFGKMIKAGNI